MIEIESIYQLILSILLGALIGLEREFKGKEAGLQTYTLVSMGACIFTMLSIGLITLAPGMSSEITLDPIRLVNAIAVGIGFIGAGVIFRQESGIIGLTTAAGLWVTAAIGIAVGIKFYLLASLSTLLALLVLSGMGLLEERILKFKKK